MKTRLCLKQDVDDTTVKRIMAFEEQLLEALWERVLISCDLYKKNAFVSVSHTHTQTLSDSLGHSQKVNAERHDLPTSNEGCSYP